MAFKINSKGALRPIYAHISEIFLKIFDMHTQVRKNDNKATNVC